MIFFKMNLVWRLIIVNDVTCHVAADFITFTTVYNIYAAACALGGHFRAPDWIPVAELQS